LQVKNLGEIKAIAFDIDGTLYENWKLNIRIIWHFLKNITFFARYGHARNLFRASGKTMNFREEQLSLMTKYYFGSESKAQKKMDDVIYEGLKKYFKKIVPCKDSLDTVKSFKEAGFKIALLSDFPPEQKGGLWGFQPYCDVILGTEACGALKPAPVSFRKMADDLGVKPEEILYVGNSHKYDVVGARNVGMKTAWFTKKKLDKTGQADIVFSRFSDLKQIILKNI